jgi:glycosyltransferase involved in cell wall biosynthesis
VTGGEALALLGPAPPDRGGIARETVLLAEELARGGPLSYFTFSRPYPRWLDPRRFADFAGGPGPATPILDWRSPRSWTETSRAVGATGARALLVPWWTAFWGLPVRSVLRALGRRAPGVSRVLICHNVEDHEATGLHRFLTLGAFLSADAFFVHSEYARSRLERLLPGRPVAVYPLPAVESARPDRESARKRLRIEGGPLVLFLGLVRLYKGVELLLSAAPRIVAETGARIAIVGESFPDAQDIERQTRDSPVRDRLLRKDSYVSEPEMDDWLAACDVLVLPYRKIAGSAIAARAIAARRPMAAARVGALAETVRPGATGELFEPGDAGGLASAVATVLTRGVESYGPGLEEAARRSTREGYANAVRTLVGSIS